MTKKELLERLEKEKISPRLYRFDKGFWGDEYVLSNPKSDVWEVFYYERGEYYSLAKFTLETEACEYFYQEVKKSSNTIK